MSGPLAIINRDARGMATSMSLIVVPCAGEPVETFERIAQARAEGRYEPWTHGVATTIVANGCDAPLAFCDACGGRWQAEAARLARLRRLPPPARSWLASHGIDDPATLTVPLGPAPDIHVGDVVQWHPEAEMNVEWTVTAVHGNGRLTIAVDLAEGETTRTISKTAFTRDCRVVGRQMALMD